ncbi:MAG: Uma2 family endonuclease [Chloroflexota bacterium]|nr:Uma2 family endonuclease [Chloroflexota bacterium]
MATEIARKQFTVDEYHRMADAGILTEDDRVELIRGEIIQLSPIGGRHAACVTELNWLLTRQLGEEVRVSVQNPIRIDEYGEPEPDLAVIRARNYAGDLPKPEDVLLLIEVADMSVSYDRDLKIPMYARAGIPESWLMDLADGAIERHSEPSEGGYRLVVRARRGQTLESTVLPSLTLKVDTLLGRTEDTSR